MPQRFCAICGKNLDKTAPHYSMCMNCYLKEHPLFELPELFSLKICQDCGSFTKSEEWNESESEDLFLIIEEAINKYILKNYLKENKIDFKLVFDEDSFEYSSMNNLKGLLLRIEGHLKADRNYSHNQLIKVQLNYELCKNCSNLRSGIFYLSILQLRVPSEKFFMIINEVLELIHKYAESLFEIDNKHYISKIEDQKYGVDLFLSTNELMNRIINYIDSHYHFILKRSKKLVGRDIQRGKNLYRLKSLLKFLPIKKKDIIVIENKEFVVENILKRTVILRDKNNTKISKDFLYFFKNEFIVKSSLGKS